jgi:hypothetical protein
MTAVPVMSTFLEALLLLLPPEAGGRTSPVAPREGSWRPFAHLNGETSRALLIEGPPSLAPGDAARVVLELEGPAGSVAPDSEFALYERDERLVGVVTVLRVCRASTSV